MSVVNRKYLPGYTGTAQINGAAVGDVPITGWSADPDAGLWDGSTPEEHGWLFQEAGQQKIAITCTMYIKLSATTSGSPAVTTYSAVMPTFGHGQTIPCTFNIFGTAAYAGNWIVDKFATKNDLKGGVTIDLSLTSQGPITGSLVPTGLTLAIPAQSGS